MVIESLLAGFAALAVSLLAIWASLGKLAKPETRWRRMAWLALGIGGVLVGAIVGLLAVAAWWLTPGTDTCTGCESARDVMGLVAMSAGAAVGIAVAIEAGRRRANPQRGLPPN